MLLFRLRRVHGRYYEIAWKRQGDKKDIWTAEDLFTDHMEINEQKKLLLESHRKELVELGKETKEVDEAIEVYSL